MTKRHRKGQLAPRKDLLFTVQSKLGVGKIRVYYDSHGNTLNVWFEDPKHEHVCEETGDEVILVKDRRGRVIGFEKLNFLPGNGKHRTLKTLPVEVLVS